MKIVFATLKGVLFWSYDRGSWQYDIMCVLILAFVFFGPNSIFHSKAEPSTQALSNPAFVTRQEVEQSSPADMEQKIAEHLSKKHGRTVRVSLVEPLMDASGNLRGYQVAWE